MGHPRLFFVFFSLFKQIVHIFTTNMWKSPFSIRWWDSNPQPSEQESPPSKRHHTEWKIDHNLRPTHSFTCWLNAWPLFVYFCLYKTVDWKSKLNSNHGSLVSESTTLPAVPQTLSSKNTIFVLHKRLSLSAGANSYLTFSTEVSQDSDSTFGRCDLPLVAVLVLILSRWKEIKTKRN